MTFAAIALVMTSFAPQGAERAVNEVERDAIFALLDRFDPLDTSKLPFVRVATGRAGHYVHEPWRNEYRYGFLKEAKGTQFLVRYLELDSGVFTRTPLGTPDYLSVGFEPVDLRTFADELLERAHRQRDPHNLDSDYRSRTTPMKTLTVALLAARACQRCGYEQHADRLLAAARSMGVPLTHAWELGWDLRTWLELAFSDPALSWGDLHALHETWLQAWPPNENNKGVVERRDALAAIVAQRRNRAPRGDPPSEADLIEDLRDLFLPTDSGGFDEWPAFVALPAPEHAQRAFDLLVGRGLAAAPVLIAALDDTTLTRSVSYCSRRGGWFTVRTLGEVARDVLVAIAGERVADWNDWRTTASRDGLPASVLRTLKSGSRESAMAWMHHSPDDLEPLFEQALLAEPLARQLLLDEVLRSGPADARSRALLLLRAEAARPHPERVAACHSLWWRRGDASGYRSLVDDWRHARVAKGDVIDHLREVFEAGIAEAWQVLAADIDAADVRDALARALPQVSRQTVLRSMRLTDGAAADASVRTCLFRLLHDVEPADRCAITTSERRVQLHAPTRADVAACTLWSLWPDEFPFDPTRTRSSRMRQIVWLRERAAGRTPPPLELPPVDPALLQLMQAIRSGTRTAKAIERLEAFGMPALPLVEDLLRERPEHSHSRALAELAVRLANQVVGVTFEPSANDLTAEEHQAVRSLIGKPIDQRSLLQALVTVATSKAAKGKRAVLHLDRSADGEGTTMRCELLDRGSSTFDLRVTEASLTLTDTAFSSGTPLDSVAALEGQGCLTAIPKALGAQSTTPVEITIGLSRQ